MKGLLIKDFNLFLQNKKVYIAFLILSLFYMGSGSGFSFGVTFMMIFLGMSSLNSISYDQYDHSDGFLMTLPVTRKIYAVEKFVYGILAMLAACLGGLAIGYLFSLFLPNVTVSKEDVVGVLVAALVFWNMIAIMIPLQLKLKGDIVRLILIGGIAAIAGISAVTAKMIYGDNWKESISAALDSMLSGVGNDLFPLIILGGIVVTVIITLISMFFAIRIMEKKQF